MPGPHGGHGGANRFAKPKNTKKTILRILHYLSPSKIPLVGVALLILITVGANLGGSYYMRPLINKLVGGGFQGPSDLLLALVPLASCAGEAGTPPEESARLEEPARERYFTDSAGRVVAVSGTITRIVPSSSLAQAVLFAIAPDMLVGLASRWNASAGGLIDRQYLDLPDYLTRRQFNVRLALEF